MNIEFNKIYIIQSLNKDEEDLTGTQLYNEVLQYLPFKQKEKEAVLINVDTPGQLFKYLKEIATDCKRDSIKPIIHFEIHGLDNRMGLSLNKGSVHWADLYEYFIAINTNSGWNLFITMAVCFGNFAMLLIQPRYPSPYMGILGSFEELYEDDLYIRYNSFYNELINTLDLEKAIEALQNSNPALPDDYRLISAEQTFKNIYQKYFDEQFTLQKARERFNNVIKEEKVKFTDRNQKQQFFNRFRAQMYSSKEEFYERDKSTFFMFDQFPGHRYIYCVDWEPKYR